MKSRIFISIILLMGYAACLISISSIGSAISLLTSSNQPSSGSGFDFAYQPLLSAISGGLLTSTVFFFFLKRMLDQYDRKHERTEIEIKALQASFNVLEIELTDKVHEKSDQIHQDVNNVLTLSTKAIIDNLESLRDTIQTLVQDQAVLRTEHSKCDYNSGDIKLVKSQLDNMNSLFKRVDKQLTKHIEEQKE